MTSYYFTHPPGERSSEILGHLPFLSYNGPVNDKDWIRVALSSFCQKDSP